MNFSIYQSINEISESEWSEFVKKRFFLSHKYLRTMELAAPQLQYRYAVSTSSEGQIECVAYFQIIPFKGTNLFQYIPSDNPFLNQILRWCIGWIDTNLLVLGNVIFTCENGLYIRENYLSNKDILAMISSVQSTVKDDLLGIMLSESLNETRRSFFCHHGFHPFRVEDRMEINIAMFHNFQDYLDRLQSKYRVRWKKINTLNELVRVVEINPDNFEKYSEDLQDLFDQVIANSKFTLTKLTANYFLEFLKGIDRFKMIGFIQDEKLIGFLTYFELDSILEVHYVGMDYKLNHSQKTYNYMLYHILEKGIKLSKSRICYGRTAQEMKSTLGALPESVISCLKVNHPLLNLFTPFFLKKLVPEKWVLREPFKK